MWRARRRQAAWHGAVSFGVVVAIDRHLGQRVCGCPWMGGHVVLGGADVGCVLLDPLSLSFYFAMPFQQEALWDAI